MGVATSTKRWINRTTAGLIRDCTGSLLVDVTQMVQEAEKDRALLLTNDLLHHLEDLIKFYELLLEGRFLAPDGFLRPWHLPENRTDLAPNGSHYKRWVPTKQEVRRRIQAAKESLQVVRDFQTRFLAADQNLGQNSREAGGTNVFP